MKLKPNKKPEKFHLILFFMDSLIYFLLAAFIAVMTPLFFGLIIANKSRAVSTNNVMDSYIVPLYSEWDSMKTLENVSLIVAVFLLLIILYRKLSKFHIYEFELQEELLKMKLINLLKKSRTNEYSFKELKLIFKKETKESDLSYSIRDVKYNKLIFDTDRSKYWFAKRDNVRLNELFVYLQKKGCKLEIVTPVTSSNNTGLISTIID